MLSYQIQTPESTRDNPTQHCGNLQSAHTINQRNASISISNGFVCTVLPSYENFGEARYKMVRSKLQGPRPQGVNRAPIGNKLCIKSAEVKIALAPPPRIRLLSAYCSTFNRACCSIEACTLVIT
jgi:hypothetical protein